MIFMLQLLILLPMAHASMERDIDAPTLPQEKLTFLPASKSDEIIKSLKEVAPEQFPLKIKSIKKEFRHFLLSQKALCEGNFASIIFNKSEESELQNYKKLGKEEKKVCLQKLRERLQSFSEEVLNSQQKFMTYVYQKNQESLQKSRDSIKNEFSNTIN